MLKQQTQETTYLLDEEREQRVIELVDQIHQLNEVSADINRMVNEQGEMLDNIELNVDTAVVNIEDGNTQLDHAQVNQRSSRKKKCCCLSILLIVFILFITILVLVAQNKL